MGSKTWQGQQSQVFPAIGLVSAIDQVEENVGHRRTVLLGDFNMDPFEQGMLGAGSLHAMMSRRTAAKQSRPIGERHYRMFYNPMWGLLGDDRPGPPGTYRYWRSEHVCQEWHAYDQVLIRPDLLQAFPAGRLRILDSAGETSLLTSQGIPTPSDHLPVVFHLGEIGEQNE